MQLARFTDNGLHTMARHIAQLKETFGTIMRHTGYFSEPACSFPGITATLADDGQSILIEYGLYAVDLRLTVVKPEEAPLRGLVTAVLVKHPLDASKPVLDSFTFDRHGGTDIEDPQDPDNQDLSAVTVVMMLTLVQAALLHRPREGVMLP